MKNIAMNFILISPVSIYLTKNRIIHSPQMCASGSPAAM
jgi:hypothetical protein